MLRGVSVPVAATPTPSHHRHLLRGVIRSCRIVDTTLDGAAWVGLVLLTEEGVSPGPCHGWLPAVSHHGANVRTYVHDAAGGRPGIFFLSLECGSLLASLGARLFAIPYWPATMARRGGGGGGGRRRQMTSRRWLLGGAGAGAELDCEWTIGDAASVVNVDPDHTWARQSRWFLERYRLYTAQRGQLYTGTISHPPWPAVPAAVERLEQSLTAAVQGLPSSCASAAPAHCCFSPGVGPVDFTMLRTATGAGQADQP